MSCGPGDGKIYRGIKHPIIIIPFSIIFVTTKAILRGGDYRTAGCSALLLKRCYKKQENQIM